MSEKDRPIFIPEALRMPETLTIRAKKRVLSLIPDEFAFVSSRTVVIDRDSNRMLLDTDDHVVHPPKSNRFQHLPVVLRVVTTLDEKLVDGYIVDYRRVVEPEIRVRADDDQPMEHTDDWRDFKTVNPLGAILSLDDGIYFKGEMELEGAALVFAKRVDKYFEAISSGIEAGDAFEIAQVASVTI